MQCDERSAVGQRYRIIEFALPTSVSIRRKASHRKTRPGNLIGSGLFCGLIVQRDHKADWKLFGVLGKGEVNCILLKRSRGTQRQAAIVGGSPAGRPPSIFASICSRKMPDGKFDLTVGKLSPLLNDRQ